jgi:hypothetical protein
VAELKRWKTFFKGASAAHNLSFQPSLKSCFTDYKDLTERRHFSVASATGDGFPSELIQSVSKAAVPLCI